MMQKSKVDLDQLTADNIESNDLDDRYKYNTFAYCLFFFLGLGNLLPWYAFITAESYYSQRFCGGQFADTFENFFSICYSIAQPIGLIISLFYGKYISLQRQVRIPLYAFAAIFIFTTISVCVDIPVSPLFYITLLSCFLVGFNGAVMNGGLFGISGILPPIYTSSMVIGSSFGGVLISISSIITQSTGLDGNCDDNDDGYSDSDCEDFKIDYSAVAYFLVSIIVIILCIFFFEILLNLPLVKYYMNKANLLENTNVTVSTNIFPLSISNDNKIMSPLLSADLLEENIDSKDTKTSRTTIAELLSVIKKIAIPGFSVFITYTISLSLFPPVIILINPEVSCPSTYSGVIFNKLWVSVLFLLYAVLDCTGQTIAERYKDYFPINEKNIWIFAICRICFIFLFLFCNISNSQLPVVFKSDAFPLILVSLLALSDGIVGNLGMMLGSSMVPLEESSLAGTFMIFCLQTGCFIGSVISFLLVYIIRGSVSN